MYYDHPDYDEAYLTDASGTFSQYMFGPSILVAPIVKQGQQFLGGGLLTSKSVWLPPGSWYNTLTGDVTVSSSVIFTRNYTLNDIPMWCAAQPLPPPQQKPPFISLAAGTVRAPLSPTSPCAPSPSSDLPLNPTLSSHSGEPLPPCPCHKP